MTDEAQAAEARVAMSRAEMWVISNRTLLMVVVWRALLPVARWLGTVWRWLSVDGRATVLLAGLTPAIVFAIRGERDQAMVAGGLWLLAVVSLAALSARDRFIIGDFIGAATQGEAPSGSVNLANLLHVELSRLGDLFQVVGDRRAVSSGLTHGLTHAGGLDATLSIDDLVENMRKTISSETKAKIGPITIPLAPVVTLFGKLLQSPRLTGNLHRDEDMLILTAQTTRRGGMSWRVEALSTPSDPSPDAATAVVSQMIQELALRIYTDLALGRAVRWQASKCFVEGLGYFRACLRTPKDRKVNLKLAEELFLEALAEDEDFPLVYYNLGVVYTELHGLAVVAGRTHEAEMRLSAAETAFGRAIERDPSRWECYFAFAQTHFRYSRFDSVTGLCSHIVRQLGAGWADEAKVQDLWAQALLGRITPEAREGDRAENYRRAIDHSMRASRLALRALARERLLRGTQRQHENDRELRCCELATACLLTFSDIYSRHMAVIADGATKRRRARQPERIRRRLQWLVKLAPMAGGKAELRFEFGRRALDGGHLRLAEEELAAARRSDPTRPSYAAGLALVRATRLANGGTITEWDRGPIVDLCLQALHGMAGAFFPSRDERAFDLLADVYALLGSDDHDDDRRTAEQLREVEREVAQRLKRSVSGTSVSGIFLEVVQSHEPPLSSKVGAYGEAVRLARAHHEGGKALSEDRRRADALAAFREALRHAERATSLNPLSTLAWETLGDVHRELSDFQNARSAWTHALGFDPDNPRLYDKIGSTYWHIAFQGRTRASREDLEHAADYFDKALRLYGTGSEAHVLTHYRLGKLNAALREFEVARGHLDIVEATHRLPIVGWGFLGFAYLERRNFSECEYYFGRVVKEGDELSSQPADLPVGDRLDEEQWPLALVRAWGHLGLAISFAERDGHLDKATEHVEAADARLGELELDEDPSRDERFPTRAAAAVLECQGLILLRKGEVEDAIDKLEEAVRQFPHSRAYFELALALEQRALLADVDRRKELVPRAERLLDHAVSLGPSEDPTIAIRQAMTRLERLQHAV